MKNSNQSQTNSFVVTLSVAGVTNTTIWNPEKPFPVGHPVRWVMERTSDGVTIRNLESEGVERELTNASLTKGVSTDLPEAGRGAKSDFNVSLLPVASLPPAFSTHEGETGELRIYACRGDWTKESFSLEEPYKAYVQDQQIFSIRHLPEGDYLIRSAAVGFQVEGSSLSIGAEIRKDAKSLAGTTLSYGEFKWRLDTLKRTDDAILATFIPLELDAEALTFKKSVQYSFAGLAVFGFLAFLWPKPKNDDLPPQMTHLVMKKPVKMRHASAAADGNSPTFDRVNGGDEGGSQSHQSEKKAVQKTAQASHTAKSTSAHHQARKVTPKQPAKSVAKAPAKKAAHAKAVAKAPAKAHAVAKAQPVAKPARAKPAHAAPVIARMTTTRPPIVKAAPVVSQATVSKHAKPTVTPSHGERDTQVAKLMGDASFRNAAKGLMSGGMSSLIGHGKLGKGDAGAESRQIMDSGASSGLGGGSLASSETLGTRHVGVSGFGGGGDGDGSGSGHGGAGSGGSGVGYGRGSHAKVAGQGKSFVSMDTGDSEVEEGLTREQVGAVIHSHMSEIRYCYEAAKLRAPDVEGKLAVAFTVSAPGSVNRAGVASSTLGDQMLNDCVVKRLVTWKFPHPKGGVNVAVNYPFIFKTLGK